MKFIIDQHGCAKNTVDAEILAAHLTAAGWTEVFGERDCGTGPLLIIVNSCGFIESAKSESIDAVMGARARYPSAKILLTGCLAQRYAAELSESLYEADGIFGNGDLSQIADVANRVMNGERVVLTPAQLGVCYAERKTLLTRKGSVYVKLTEGCGNRCAFCAIPIIRGGLRSREAADVMTEIKRFVDNGVYEINLIGQDVASYPHLLPLLQEISALDKDGFIVRLLYMHPDHFDSAILPVMQKGQCIVPYFDIPFQSGCDRIIHAMGRRKSAAEYVQLVDSIREVLPHAAIRTTFMAGFPGEDDEAAAETVRFLRRIKPDWSGCFAYSREEGTAAYNMAGQVSGKTAAARVRAITAAQEEVTRTALTARLGREYDVLIEEIIAPNADNAQDGMAIGRAWFQAPEVDGAFVVHYNAEDKAARQEVAAGAVVRAYADAVSGVDIDAHLCCDASDTCDTHCQPRYGKERAARGQLHWGVDDAE